MSRSSLRHAVLAALQVRSYDIARDIVKRNDLMGRVCPLCGARIGSRCGEKANFTPRKGLIVCTVCWVAFSFSVEKGRKRFVDYDDETVVVDHPYDIGPAASVQTTFARLLDRMRTVRLRTGTYDIDRPIKLWGVSNVHVDFGNSTITFHKNESR